MSDTIITVENLSKRYKLGVIGATSLRESVERGWHKLRGRDWRHHMGTVGAAQPRPIKTLDIRHSTLDQGAGGGASAESLTSNVQSPASSPDSLKSKVQSLKSNSSHSDELWALRDVSFEVKRGEVLGVIGRNGAGKSTLLKILTRITEPTSGRAIMRGRVASLLEVGTGFHPELTGRENVYLNGAILGMKRAEITRKFDEIVAFAEIEKFIDTPVKRYSSGMYVRLAFAVAAHLEPEILLVDEVLAVGDAAFQKRCLGKMGEVAKAGRTVLFVSHNMTAVATLCPRAILLKYGRMVLDGPSPEVVTAYHDEMVDVVRSEIDIGDEHVRYIGASIQNASGDNVKSVEVHEPLHVKMTYRIIKDISGIVVPNFHFYTPAGVCCFVSSAPGLKPHAGPGVYTAICTVPGKLLNEGTFAVGVACTSYFGDRFVVNFFEHALLPVTIRDARIPNDENYGYAQVRPGILHPRLAWNVVKTGDE